MTGGMRRMGAGRKALVMAVSLTARWAAMTEVPTSCPISSTTAIPSLNSLFLINTAFSVLAVAGERGRGNGSRSPNEGFGSGRLRKR